VAQRLWGITRALEQQHFSVSVSSTANCIFAPVLLLAD
jgi:hypothetical protein